MNNIPKGWRKVKFGDVVDRIKDQEPDRSKWTTDKYIGGQHFPEGEIRVTEYGSIKEDEWVIGSAFKIKFKPGDVLYVTRNPRLRKGGMVDFEGICSDVTYVLRADENQLLQSLLPFIIQTEDFVKHTCNNAHGSTNPFLNWKDIAKYEFYLPPLEGQEKIGEVLWSVEEDIQQSEIRISKKLFLKRKILNYYIGSKLSTKYIGSDKLMKKIKNGSVQRFSDLICVNPKRKIERKSVAKYVGMENISEWNPKIKNFKIKPYLGSGSKFKNGDTLFARITPCLENGKTAYIDILNRDEIAWGSTELIVLSGKKNFSTNLFVYYVSISPFLRKIAIDWMIGTSGRQRVPNEVFKKIYFDIPSTDEQKKIVENLLKLDESLTKLYDYESSLKSLRNKLLNELLLGKFRLEDQNVQ